MDTYGMGNVEEASGGSSYVAPKTVTWALIVFGAFEIVWVIYLVFNQARTGQAFHIRLASVGLTAAVAVLCGVTSWMLWTRRRAAAALGIAAATVALFSAMVVTLSPSLRSGGLVNADFVPLLLAVVAAAGATIGAWAVLRDDADPGNTLLKFAIACLALVAGAAAIRTGQHLTTSVTSELATHTRGMVVILDTAETIGLLGAGIASLRGLLRPTFVFATMATALFICDAWVNVVMVPSGPAFQAALVFLFIGELPSIVLCSIAAVWAWRKTNLPIAVVEPTPELAA